MRKDVTVISDPRLGDSYYCVKHPSGLKIYLYPKTEFTTTYAMFSTRYGSIDTKFQLNTDDKVHTVPAGIAHFLEHKLFESEEGDAFQRYAATGASANAFTSFESTCYLFSTSQNFYEALRVLLDFVQSPYFTEETVKKEQGIIGQEIRMYDDDPQWKVMFNLLGALYHRHTVKEDIAGTVESISEITPEYLMDCYKTFYNLSNMSLVAAGNLSVDQVLDLCDEMLKPAEPVIVNRFFEEEPDSLVSRRVTQQLAVASPLFQIGYKENIKGLMDERTVAVTEILLDILACDSSPLFKRLLDMELINEASFNYEFFEGESFSAVLFGGESKDPDAVLLELNREIARLREEGIPEEDFVRAKKSIYGTHISGLNSAANIANAITHLDFKGRELFRYIHSFADITLTEVEKRLHEIMDAETGAISLVLPLAGKDKVQ